eukprot:3938687-Rhodomonas_salina.1
MSLITDLLNQPTLSAQEVWKAAEITESTRGMRMRRPPQGASGDRFKGDLPENFHVAQTALSFLICADTGARKLAVAQEKLALAPPAGSKIWIRNPITHKRTKRRTKYHWQIEIDKARDDCITRCRAVVTGWTVMCHILLTGAPCLSFCRIVSNKLEYDEKEHEVDCKGMAQSRRAYLAMCSRVLTFSGTGFKSGCAVASVGLPVPHKSFDSMLEAVG